MIDFGFKHLQGLAPKRALILGAVLACALGCRTEASSDRAAWIALRCRAKVGAALIVQPEECRSRTADIRFATRAVPIVAILILSDRAISEADSAAIAFAAPGIPHLRLSMTTASSLASMDLDFTPGLFLGIVSFVQPHSFHSTTIDDSCARRFNDYTYCALLEAEENEKDTATGDRPRHRNVVRAIARQVSGYSR